MSELINWLNAMPWWLFVVTVFLDGAGLATMTAILLWLRSRNKLIGRINEWLKEHDVDLELGVER